MAEDLGEMDQKALRVETARDSDGEAGEGLGMDLMSPTGGTRSKAQRRYATVSYYCSLIFWVILFFMTNFVYLYMSLKDFAVSDGVWYTATTLFVAGLTVSYLLHRWYDCLAHAQSMVRDGDGGVEDEGVLVDAKQETA